MLSELQDHLAGIYRADPGYDVMDFLVTDRALAAALGDGAMLPGTDETVLLAEDDDGLAVSVFLDPQMLERLAAAKPLDGLSEVSLNDLWTVLEGLSHFNYIAWRASRNRSLSLLELELQAEVDKFVSTFLLALHQEDGAIAGRLHGWLFDEVSFKPALSDVERARYETANSYAGRYCHGLLERLASDRRGGLNELRQFYRLSQHDKISHIHSHSHGA